MAQPCVDMRKNEHGEFIHHPQTTEFTDEGRPGVVLLETRCEECGHILLSEIVDLNADAEETD